MIAQTLGIPEGRQSAIERLKESLRDRQMLLILDNVEQVLASATEVAELLTACPFVKMLVTSRAPMRIRREYQFPVPALTLPDLTCLPNVEHLSSFAAVELFVERAQAVNPNFTLTPENSQPVAAICNRLDGLPLAIELISARVKLLPPAVLLERLHGRLLLRSDGLRDLEPRHRTLNAAIDWSYGLLTSDEQAVFIRLGVFVGGWGIDAAEEICQLRSGEVDSLALLLDKSLIHQRVDRSDNLRFAMLETIREYAFERLAESGENQEIRRRHASFFLKLAETQDIEQPTWLDQIEQDYDNLRAALDWCFTNEFETGLRLAVAICSYWLQRYLSDGHFWMKKYLGAYRQSEMISPGILRSALVQATSVAYFVDNLASMRQTTAALLTLGQERQDQASIMHALHFQGMDALMDNDVGRAKALFEEGLLLCRQLGDTHQSAYILLMLGNVAVMQKDYERAYALKSESLGMYRQIGNRWAEAMLLLDNGGIQELQVDYDGARDLIRQGLRISRQNGDKRMLSDALDQLARLESQKGEHERAAQLMGAAEALRTSIFVSIEPLGRSQYEQWVAQVRANLDDSTFAAAWAEGRLLTMEQAIEHAFLE